MAMSKDDISSLGIEQQNIFEELLAAMLDGIFHLDMQGHFLYANRAFAQFVHLPIHEIVGCTVEELSFPIPLEPARLAHVDFATPQGVRHFEYTLSPIYANDGTMKALVGVIRDITARAEDEQQMNAFFSLASHELRTPLTAIKGNVQLALRQLRRLIKIDAPGVGEFATKIEDMLTRAERQVDVESRMVGGMLDISRIQKNRLEIRLHRINLVDVVSTAISNERAAEPTRVISLVLPPQDTIPVYADAERIEQVLSGYLSNALKYAPPELPIAVFVETNSQDVRVSVHDEGAGLTAEEQQRVWDRFYQTPNRTVLNGQSTGLGLGLYICKTLIERQHGTVGVESEEGKGTTFWFTLPLVHTDAP